MDNPILIDITGWVGVAALLVAYALVSTKRLAGDSTAYQLLNLLGSALLIVNSFYYGAYPSVGVNIAWVGIAVYVLTRKRRGGKQQPT
ncbi:MAG TPA: hypothetical protein VJ754_01695 [Anaerolineae bacterium]|nr:hypothetical protein [Anaerolineae bacterium]